MRANRCHTQPSIMSYLKAKPMVRSGSSYGQRSKRDIKNSGDMCFARRFPTTTTQPAAKKWQAFYESEECKAPSMTPSPPSPSPPPPPTAVLSHLCLTQQQQPSFAGNNTKSRKRKFESYEMKEDEHGISRSSAGRDGKPLLKSSQNCLQKVTLSDGSVCYTMTASSPASASAIAAAAASAYCVSQPPTKKQRCDGTRGDSNNKAAKTSALLCVDHSAARQKNTLVYSDTMPLMPTNKNKENAERKMRKRRHSHTDKWTSKEKLLTALQEQTSIQDELFPDTRGVPSVDLKEMFGGLKLIRVHKKLRPINSRRRETQIFN